MVNSPLIRPYFLGGVAWGGTLRFPWLKYVTQSAAKCTKRHLPLWNPGTTLAVVLQPFFVELVQSQIRRSHGIRIFQPSNTKTGLLFGLAKKESLKKTCKFENFKNSLKKWWCIVCVLEIINILQLQELNQAKLWDESNKIILRFFWWVIFVQASATFEVNKSSLLLKEAIVLAFQKNKFGAKCTSQKKKKKSSSLIPWSLLVHH